LIDRKRKIVYIHIPKTYGVSTRVSFGWIGNPEDLDRFNYSFDEVKI
tara:strand:- start:347 stop:487 length:141 start_codon:yes stop_codon:yes gene_type:complete